MTSAQKIRANRANARASTGPKTAVGRARSARNALRHAFSLPVCSNPELSEEVETLAREIAGPGASAEIQELARRVAEAQIDLRRVRCARYQLMCDLLRDPHYEPRATTRMKVKAISDFLRPNAPETSMAMLEKFLASTPEGPEKVALIVSQEARRLMAMDRYERGALARRKFAIRAFDDARRSDCSKINNN